MDNVLCRHEILRWCCAQCLREALERIKTADPEIDLGAFYIFAKETASEALEGAADSASGGQNENSTG